MLPINKMRQELLNIMGDMTLIEERMPMMDGEERKEAEEDWAALSIMRRDLMKKLQPGVEN